MSHLKPGVLAVELTDDKYTVHLFIRVINCCYLHCLIHPGSQSCDICNGKWKRFTSTLSFYLLSKIILVMGCPYLTLVLCLIFCFHVWIGDAEKSPELSCHASNACSSLVRYEFVLDGNSLLNVSYIVSLIR